MVRKCLNCAAPAAEGRVRCEAHLARAREAMRVWARAHPEKAKRNGRNNYTRHREGYAERIRRNRAKKPAQYKAKDAEYYRKNRAAWFKRSVGKYGLTVEEYEAMLAAQGGGCALCGSDKAGGIGRFHVDHDHRFAMGDKRGVRGILCHRCNTGIGALGDNLDAMERAMRYVSRFESWTAVRP